MKTRLILLIVLSLVSTLGVTLMVSGAEYPLDDVDYDLVDWMDVNDSYSTFNTGRIIFAGTGIAGIIMGIVTLVQPKDSRARGLIIASGILAIIGVGFVTVITAAIALAKISKGEDPADSHHRWQDYDGETPLDLQSPTEPHGVPEDAEIPYKQTPKPEKTPEQKAAAEAEMKKIKARLSELEKETKDNK